MTEIRDAEAWACLCALSFPDEYDTTGAFETLRDYIWQLRDEIGQQAAVKRECENAFLLALAAKQEEVNFYDRAVDCSISELVSARIKSWSYGAWRTYIHNLAKENRPVVGNG